MIEDFITSPLTPPNRHLILILCTRSPIKTRMSISRLRAVLRNVCDETVWAAKQRKQAKNRGEQFDWKIYAMRVHFLGVEVDLTDLNSVYAMADRLVNGTVGTPDATTADGLKLPHGSPGTASYSEDIVQDRWALNLGDGAGGYSRVWGWGLHDIRVPRIDAVLLTAGIGGWTGINWPVAVWTILTNWVEATTWPTFKLPDYGATVRKQRGSRTEESEEKQSLLQAQQREDEPPLGKVFCANVFGHYILAHQLMPLLSRPAPGANIGGKIIWVSSAEPLKHHLNLDDIQALKSHSPYEASKRLIDTMAITAVLPSVKKASASYFETSDVVVVAKEGEEDTQNVPLQKPTIHVVHPGIFVSDIIVLNAFLVTLWGLAFYVARWLGSPWHTLSSDKAANVVASIALQDHDELEEVEEHGQARCKWGSATTAGGKERILKTEVAGWGWNGKVGWQSEAGRLGRKRDAIDLTREGREEFEEQGAKAWSQMEALRRTWADILDVKKN